ncbi:MAG: riboflavin synthase [Planctomycetota bacterium]|nr:riboflavin synthase [Planctomycetota bacterium]MDA1250665.1 riboflavin synthase [Planctomycetota bacterium]
MFTGLIEGQGRVSAILPEGEAIRLEIDAGESIAAGLSIGDSVSINGCCLTVVELAEPVVAFQAGTETLSRTNLGRLQPGDPVNLERSLPVDGRLGGHFVQGHVDGVGKVASIDRDGDWITMWFEIPVALAKFLVPKGSVAVDGISLTVVNVEQTRFSVALIPHTLEVTTLGVRDVGDPVNIETDILGKYVERLLPFRSA